MRVLKRRALQQIGVVLIFVQAVALWTGCSDDGTAGKSGNNGTLPTVSELVNVGEVSGTTSEAGVQATFDVVLEVQPQADVVLNLASDTPEEGKIDKTTLTFTSDNWDAPQTITVTGQDDDEADGDQVFAVTFEPMGSEDERFAGLEPASVEVVNIDDDTAGFTVSEPTGDTTEAGGQSSFTVVLNAQPKADVTVALASSDPEEGVVGNSSLTFTSENWNAPQTVTVTGRDDDLADGNQTYQVTFGDTTSEDEDYAAIKPTDIELINIDDDTAGFTVSEPTGDTTEAGGQSSFTVVLNAQPKADVTVALASSDPEEGVVGNSNLTFTTENWNAPQIVTVTGQDDDLADGNQTYQVVFGGTTSDDEGYAAIKPTDVELTNIDDETPGITVDVLDATTSEGGAQASFTVMLNSEPYDDVTLSFDTNDAGEGTLDRTELTFTSTNYNAPQTVTITGQNDDLTDGDQPYMVVFQATTSNDASYASITPQSLDITNIDDDSAGITVTPVSGPTTEAGTQATFTVMLNSEPFEEVTVNFDSDNAGEGVVDKTSLTFTAQNWNAPQTVTITGQDDDLADGNQPYNVVFQATTSNDATYAQITPQNVAVTNVDNDSAGITVSAVTGPTDEAGGQATFTVVLNSEPYDDVTLSFDTSNADEGTLDRTALTFTAQNWNAPQTVTITGQDDDLADGNQPYNVVFQATTSNDATYAQITPQNVAVTNVDNDSAGITVSAVTGPTSEDGGQATFTVALNSEPYDDVTLSFDTSNADEGTLDRTALTFTSTNWSAPQAVTITGQDDDLADGNQSYNVVFQATTSNDAAYAQITPQNVAVTNVDNDSAGISVSAVTGDTTEAGGQATFTVILNSKPYDDVTLSFDTSNADEGTLDRTALTFTAQNWNAPQTVTITGQDDDLADGNQSYNVVFQATTSNDAAYAQITPQNVAVTNIDNDSAGITVSAITGPTSEAGGQATFTVALNSEPYDDVTIAFDSTDVGEGVVDQTSLTFTTQNWSTPQTVTVTGQDDDLADGDQPYAIAFGATASNDLAYAAITPQNVAVTNTDDDSAAISVSTISGNTSEDGGQATFTVVLNSEPYNDVTVSFDTDDPSEGSVATNNLTFTPADWDVPQTVVVTGVSDSIADGDQSYSIVFNPSSSLDPGYDGLQPSPVAVTNEESSLCGDGSLDPGEELDPPPGPFSSVSVDANTCRWDFSSVSQLYCNGGCTWAGGSSCDQADADIFCKLKTDNPNSTASSFSTATALDEPGFSCPTLGTNIGTLPSRGVNRDVWYQDSSILANHGPGTIVTNVSCTNP